MIEPFLSDDELLDDVERTAEDGLSLHIWWLGQSGYLLKFGPWQLLVDPYLSDSLTKKYALTDKPHVRMTRQVVDPKRLRDVMFVTASHAHTDHLDGDTLRSLNHPDSAAQLIAPRAIAATAIERWGGTEKLTLMNDNESQVWGDVAVRAVPAAHDSLERDGDGNFKCLGYVFGLGGLNVYHSGDTVLYEGMAERLSPFEVDLALLPINGKVGNMNGADAARLAHDIGAKLVVPCHYDMFEFNTASPNELFIPECERLGQPYKVLRAGERLTLTR